MMTEGKNKFGAGIVVGVVGTLACLGGLAVFAIMRAPSVDDGLRKNVEKQSADEQARLGIDCKNVDVDLKRYLSSQDVEALSNQRKSLAEWKQSLTRSVVDQTAKVTELIAVCAPIYTRGRKGKLNGLDHLRFATFEVHGELILLNSMLKYQPLDRCDEACLKSTRSAIQEAISSLRKRVDGDTEPTRSVTQ